MCVDVPRKKRILIVEDNRYTLEIAQVLLESVGYEVLKTHTGEEAIEIAMHERLDLVLMDISLPLMDGNQAIRILRQNRTTKSIPIVIFTAHAMIEDEDHSGYVECDGYIFKPFERDGFLEQVRRYLH